MRSLMCLVALGLVSWIPLFSSAATKSEKPMLSDEVEGGMKYRLIGPFRGGRSAAVTGVPGDRTTFYFGATGGGVWRTGDGGSNWEPISDGFFGGSIGAVAVSESDPNVIYVGGGEKTVRGNVSHGSGMWKSVDRGKSWVSIGLTDSHHIPRVRIHPRNPDLVYAAVMGHLYAPNEQRGVFRSKDGGASWERILFVNEHAGAVDLILDPHNPRVLYATTWRIRRTPYSLESGGEGSGIWKSTDGGDTWKELSENKGLPKGPLGISGITASPARQDLLFAIVEAAEGGVFRSNDGGQTWTKLNDERKLRQRAWYYTRIVADPKNEAVVYVLNVRFWKSQDGGKSYQSIATPHGDHHDLWIDPADPERMVIGDDGGAQVSYDGGNNWSVYTNQATAQFYRVTTDNHFPYRIYAAQQDNSTVRILHRSSGSTIDEGDWEPTAGGESGHIAPHPENPDIVYGGSYGGFLMRLDHQTEQARLVNIWPRNPMGHGSADLRYRFQWNFPILFSPHDANTLYAAGNVLFRSRDEGQTWEPISPDLTRDDKTKQGSSGGPITKDNTSVEYYCTIFAVAESTHEAGVLWVGSDDGLIHLSRNGGQDWQAVTPSTMPEWSQVNSIEIDPFNPGGLYVAATRYKLGDFKPLLFKTENYGKTWRTLTTGIDEQHFTRVIRADPKRKGLLYAGTESGVYLSLNDGRNWESFQLNLPIVPITDMAIKEDDLVVATQGRSLWVLDDLTPLHHVKPAGKQLAVELFPPRKTFLMGGSRSARKGAHGENPPNGVRIRYYLAEAPEQSDETLKQDKDVSSYEKDNRNRITLTFHDDTGRTIASYDNLPKKEDGDTQLEPKQGLNEFVWSMRDGKAEGFPGMVLWNRNLQGPRVPPGRYQVKLTYGDTTLERSFDILADPRTMATPEDLQAQYQFLLGIRDKLTQVHQVVGEIRDIRKQVDRLLKPLAKHEEYKSVTDAGEALKEKMKVIEEALYQTQNRSRQDPLNYPIRLNDQLAGVGYVAGFGFWRPTAAVNAVHQQLEQEINEHLDQFKRLKKENVAAFNELVASARVPAIWLETKDEKPSTNGED